jgi:hypothetical protein
VNVEDVTPLSDWSGQSHVLEAQIVQSASPCRSLFHETPSHTQCDIGLGTRYTRTYLSCLNVLSTWSKKSTYHLSMSCGSISYTSPSFTRMSYGAAFFPPSASSGRPVNGSHVRLGARGLLTTYPKNTTGRGYDEAMMRASSILCNSLSSGSSSAGTHNGEPSDQICDFT